MDMKSGSRIPGTFYRRPSPEEPPFKEVGDAVAKGDVVGLVEVMKTFHEIKADAEGRDRSLSSSRMANR